jgi:hypothetical protein
MTGQISENDLTIPWAIMDFSFPYHHVLDMMSVKTTQ